jgi:NTP pyrophosphatase (non-canonical NTP hydrolase)
VSADGTTLAAFQRRIEEVYGARDRERGLAGTFLWLVEEIGELSRAVRRGDPSEMREEFGDVLAWLTTCASLAGVEMQQAASAYARGCKTCGSTPCRCPRRRSPLLEGAAD